MAWHGYLSTTNLNLTNPQHTALITAVAALGPGSDPSPAKLNHRVTLTGGSVTIFEALFDEATITIAAWKDRLGTILSVDPATISTDTVTRHYSQEATSVVTYTQGGVEYIQVALYGDVGIAWMTSGNEARAYVAGHLFVAADDATANEKSRADYQCDGVADQAQIATALGLARTVELSSGTFNITAAVTIPTDKTLSGQAAWATIIYADMAGAAIDQGIRSTLQNIYLSSDGAGTEASGIVVDSNATITNVFLKAQQWGINVARKTNVTITNVHFDDVRAPSTWASCVHCNSGTDGLEIDGFYANDCDRGIEIEDGSQNVTARNGTLTDVDEYPLDVHTHAGMGLTGNVLYENFVLTRCGELGTKGATDAPSDDRCENVTFRNIQTIDSILGGWGYAVIVARSDTVLLDTITVSGCPAGKELGEVDSTDVTIVDFVIE